MNESQPGRAVGTDIQLRWLVRFRHLRLGYNYILSPLFLFGLWMVGARWTLRTLTAFVVVHLLLYGGANAYNTYYDRDEGPIGGMERPPPVDRRLGLYAQILQGLGAVVSWGFGVWFGMVYLILWGLFTAYSHPGPRLKGSLIGSSFVVAGGQGGLGTLLGVLAVSGEGFSEGVLLLGTGLGGAMLATLGWYPLSQIYQYKEDRRRGERSLAVVLGARGTGFFSAICWFVAAPLLAWAFWLRGDVVLAMAVMVVLVGSGGAVFARLGVDSSKPLPTYREVMVGQGVVSTVFVVALMPGLM